MMLAFFWPIDLRHLITMWLAFDFVLTLRWALGDFFVYLLARDRDVGGPSLFRRAGQDRSCCGLIGSIWSSLRVSGERGDSAF
jgi:hypothetical protein